MNAAPHDPLKAPLRNAALSTSPAFSPELHNRLMDALRAKPLESLPAADRLAEGPSVFRKALLPLALAAASAVVAWFILNPADRVAGPGLAQQVVEIPTFSPGFFVAPVKEAVGTPTASAFEQAKYGYLDKDVRRLAVFVADQIPSFPDVEMPK